MFEHLQNNIFRALFGVVVSVGLLRAVSAAPTTQPSSEPQPMRREIQTDSGTKVQYLLTEPQKSTAPQDRWMVVFLHGAGGSLKGYNFSRPQYAKIREALSQNGAYVVVPALGPLHFMNAQAKESLTAVIDQLAKEYQIDSRHVHLIGTSMGAGSVLAYAVNYPERVRSVCAIMPMTDFAVWAVESPKYGERLKVAYGGAPQENPSAYDLNSSLKHVDALANIRVMLIHGVKDPTVAVSHSDNLAAAMKKLGYTFEYIRVEDAGHSDDIVAGIQDQIARFLIDANGAK